jgi:N-acetylglucosaminyldiphosphoundecaprenol N-acetyl-beta-D-mannosaminyltransferase
MNIPAPLKFMDVPIHPVNSAQLVETIVQWGKERKLRRVYNVNVHAMNIAQEQPDFRRYLQTADLVFCDGYGVKWLARLLHIDIPYRLTPPDWVDDFARASAQAGQSVFILGDENGLADQFGRTLESRHPGYRHAGAHHGFFKKTGPENDAIIKMINDSGATHLLVGFGMPLQERWIEANVDALQVKVAISVGALFRWYLGIEARAPKWMADRGLEWVPRLMRHPVRHFRRYVVGNPLFLARVLRRRLIDAIGVSRLSIFPYVY